MCVSFNIIVHGIYLIYIFYIGLCVIISDLVVFFGWFQYLCEVLEYFLVGIVLHVYKKNAHQNASIRYNIYIFCIYILYVSR